MMRNFTKLLTLCVFVLLSLLACTKPIENKVITLATTTSTENSGLLEYLLPKFQQASGIEVRVIAVGTGKALRMAQDGDIDVLMVHAKPAEEAFIKAGYGVERIELMYNDFVFVGPKDDPVGLNTLREVNEVMSALAYSEELFISRGDDSGTHKKEQRLWNRAGVMPSEDSYREAGQGMGKTLQIANELQAYTMIDRGTWLSYHDKVNLDIAFQGAPPLLNQYSVILINPERYPDLNADGASEFIKWLISAPGQALIGSYKVHDQVLFTPNAGKI